MHTYRISGDGVVGTFGVPSRGTRHPAVLALGGSDGGSPEYFLNLLVQDGFACLALAYWGAEGTQANMTEMPIERIERGLQWLAHHADVAAPTGRVGVMGASRGGELALLVATIYPALVGPVVAYTPSSVVWQGIDMTLPPGTTRSSWSRAGQPLPYVAYPAGVAPRQSARGFVMRPLAEGGLADTASVEIAAIPVERATGPILLVSGGDDQVWSTSRMSRMIVDRMNRYGRGADVRHLDYPDAGHMLFPYMRPADSIWPLFPVDLGGTDAADAAAHADAWPQACATLRVL